MGSRVLKDGAVPVAAFLEAALADAERDLEEALATIHHVRMITAECRARDIDLTTHAFGDLIRLGVVPGKIALRIIPGGKC